MEPIRWSPLTTLAVGTFTRLDLRNPDQRSVIICLRGCLAPISNSKQVQAAEHERAAWMIVVRISHGFSTSGIVIHCMITLLSGLSSSPVKSAQLWRSQLSPSARMSTA
jgi:hypothetical protein